MAKEHASHPVILDGIDHQHTNGNQAAAEVDPPRLPTLPVAAFPMRARQFRLPKTFSSLRHPNFRLYVFGQLISGIGTWMQIIAQGWLVYQLSKSELALGVVGFAAALPALLITPWGGVVVDRVPLRKLMLITQSASISTLSKKGKGGRKKGEGSVN